MPDLTELIEQDLGQPIKQGRRLYWSCPFHADGKTPSLTIVPDGDRFKCFGCGKAGGAIVWLMEQRGLTEIQAYEEAQRMGLADGWDVEKTLLRTTKANRQKQKRQCPAPVTRDVAPPSVTWQEQARVFVSYCAEALYTDTGRFGLDWLHRRGLSDDTIKARRLGWHDRDRWRDPQKWGLGDGKKVYLAGGVIIPWTVGGDVWHVKVRRFADDPPKYIRVRGGQPTLYGMDFIKGKRVAVICEGELDAALLWQGAGDLVDVVAIGSKGAKVALPFLARLAGATGWLVALDDDADEKAQEWGDFSPRVRRVRPLQGNDLTEFAQAGGDLRQWVRFHLDKDRLDNGTRPQDVATAAPDLEAQATALLARRDNLPHWAREWADLAERAGWPCWGFATWADWAAGVAASLQDR